MTNLQKGGFNRPPVGSHSRGRSANLPIPGLIQGMAKKSYINTRSVGTMPAVISPNGVKTYLSPQKARGSSVIGLLSTIPPLMRMTRRLQIVNFMNELRR